MISRLLAGLGAAVLGLGAASAQAQGCIGPAPCAGGYAPASPAYVFQPGPTPAYEGGQVGGYEGYAPYRPAPGEYAPRSYPASPGYAQGYDRYGGEYAHGYEREAYGAEGRAPYGYPQPPMPAGPRSYGYVPAYGRGVHADRPFTGTGYGYTMQSYQAQGGFQPCANPCGYGQGYGAESAYIDQAPAPVAYQAEAPASALAVAPDFFYGLSGGSGGFPEGGGGGGGGGFVDNGFGFSAVNNFQNNFAYGSANANANAQTAVNINVNAAAYANAHANAMANAYAMNKMYAHPMYGHPMYGHPMKKGCNCGHGHP